MKNWVLKIGGFPELFTEHPERVKEKDSLYRTERIVFHMDSNQKSHEIINTKCYF